MLHAFIDESGIHQGAKFCVVAGYVGGIRHWKRFDEVWSGRPNFHAKSFFARDPNGMRVSPYKGWSDKTAQSYFNDLLKAITSVNIYPIGGVVNIEDFLEFSKEERAHLTGGDGLIKRKPTLTGAPSKPYFLAFQEVIVGALLRLKDKSLKVHFTFDEQKQFASLALKLYQQFKNDQEPYTEQLGDAIFSSRSEAVGLQAADLLCYSWYQAVSKNSQGIDNGIRRFLYLQKVKRLMYFNKDVMDKVLAKRPAQGPSRVHKIG